MIGRLRFRLSGYSRPGLEPDLLCETCGLAWGYGYWFPRRCRDCRKIAQAHGWSSEQSTNTPSSAALEQGRRTP